MTNVLLEGKMVNVTVADFGNMTFGEQLRLIRRTNVLVGAHGAGLMNIIYAAEEAVLVEIHPSYRQDRHFRIASRLAGKIYMPIRSCVREKCNRTSDNILVPIDVFRTTMDGAVRIARSFGPGHSECGLNCSGKILAIDKRLLPYYDETKTRLSDPLNLKFPC